MKTPGFFPSENHISIKEMPIGIVLIEPNQEITLHNKPIVVFRPVGLLFHVPDDCELAVTSIIVGNIECLVGVTNILDIRMLSDKISKDCRLRLDIPTMNPGCAIKIRIKSFESKRTIRVSGSVEGFIISNET